MIYLDNAATTRPLDELNGVYELYAGKMWQNPSALYAPAVEVRTEMKKAERMLLKAFGSEECKCFFTGSGTEGANTVVLRGARRKKNMNYVCGGAEHPCVAEAFKSLEEQGNEVRYVKPYKDGYVSADSVADRVDADTALVSVMHVNNETGAKNDIRAIAAMVKAKNSRALFHSDGVQAFLREELPGVSNIDYYTVSAHKIHAHKGTGAVFYRRGAPLKPYLLGGGQENGLRSGTENTLGVFSFAYAAEWLQSRREEAKEKFEALRGELLYGLSGISGMRLIGPEEEERRCAHIVNLSFEGINGETLLHSLEAEGVYISTGAACSSKKGKPRLARMLGIGESVAAGAVRISFSLFNTVDEIRAACKLIEKNVGALRRYSRV